MSINFKTEEYYKRFIELQEKLRKSEEERLKLEMKFNEMIQVNREEEEMYFRKLHSKYKRFLEEDRRRQDRNERILRSLDRIESRIELLVAKTERFKLLKHQYQNYLDRITSSTHNSVETQTVLEASEMKKDDSDLVQSYIQNLSSIKLKEMLRKEKDETARTRSFGPLVDFNERYKYPSDLEYLNKPNYASAVADGIISTIYQRNKKTHDPTAKNKNVEFPQFSSGDTETDDFSESDEILYKNPVKFDEIQKAKDKEFNLLKKLSLDDRKSDFGTIRGFEDIKKPDSDNLKLFTNELNILGKKSTDTERINTPDLVKDQTRTEINTTEFNLPEKYTALESSVKLNKLPVQLNQSDQPESTEMYDNIQPLLHQQYNQPDDAQPPQLNEQITDHYEQPIQQTLEKTDQPIEETSLIQPVQILNEELIDQQDKPIQQYNESDQLSQRYDEPEQQVQQYNEHSQLSQHYDETNQPIQQYDKQDQQYDEHNQPRQQYDEQGQPLQPYDEQIQPFQQYNEQGQVIQQYQEQGQPIQQFHEQGQPLQQYDEEGQPLQQYDEQSQAIQQYHEQSQSLQQYDEQDQPLQQYDEQSQLLQQYDEQGQPLQQYDAQGLPLQQYDEQSQPLQQYDEYGQPIQQYDDQGQPIQQYYDQGQPLQQYDEQGQPIQQYDGNYDQNAQYDEHGQLISAYDQHQYDEHGQLIQQYDNYQPQYDENGQLLQEYAYDGNYDEHGQLYDGQQQQHYEENSTIVDTHQDTAAVEEKTSEVVEDKKEMKVSNVMEMLDTDSESVQNVKVSNDSDFDFSNG